MTDHSPEEETLPLGPSEKELFLGALEIDDPGERATWLAEACGEDSALHARVTALLKIEEEGLENTFLAPDQERLDEAVSAAGRKLWNEKAALEARTLGDDRDQAAAHLLEVASNEKPGDTIGRYKLLQKIGEGGGGVVYMADQTEPVKRRVALKVIKLGMDTRQVVARFEAERQALAMMEHPNIAKVLDAGSTESGRPYFVMELVRGVPITKFCDENKLSTKERLELFMQVREAVQHAHQKGIIHRDLKPGNVLVTMMEDRPIPKVIDFGVAKATQQELTEKTLFTQHGHFIGTPAYMSPEQASMTGYDIDTRSDIYALGVLLYELLTGKTPFDSTALLKAGYDEIRRVIAEDEPSRPSTRLSIMDDGELTALASHRQSEPRRLSRLVRGDLDWIVMKALEKDRRRRYETANGFAMDVRRFLANEPISAGRPSLAHKLSKFARRNKTAVTAGITIAALLIVSTILSLWQASRTAEQKEIVVEERDKVMQEKRHVEEEKRRGGQLLSRNDEQQGIRALHDGGNITKAIAHLVRALRTDPDNETARFRLLSTVTYGNSKSALPPPPLWQTPEKTVLSLVTPDLSTLVTGLDDGSIRVANLPTWDIRTETELFAQYPPGAALGDPGNHQEPLPLVYTYRVNSLADLKSALLHDADGVECDIRITSDGVLVCTAEGGKEEVDGRKVPRIAQHTFKELRNLKFPRRHGGKAAKTSVAPIPTFSQFLAEIPSDKHLLIEIKCDDQENGDLDPRLLPALAEAFQESTLPPEMISISSFHAHVLAECRAKLPNYPTIWLIDPFIWSTAEAIRTELGISGAGAIALAAHPRISTHPEFTNIIASIREEGIGFLCWTQQGMSARETALEFIALGAGMVVTDEPDQVTKLRSLPSRMAMAASNPDKEHELPLIPIRLLKGGSSGDRQADSIGNRWFVRREDGRVSIQNKEGEESINFAAFDEPGGQGGLRLVADDRVLLVWNDDPGGGASSLTAWDICSRTALPMIRKLRDDDAIDDPSQPAAISADDRDFVTVTKEEIRFSENNEAKISVFDRNGKMIVHFYAAAGGDVPLALSADRKTAAVGAADGRIHVWDPATGDEICSPVLAGGSIDKIALSRDGKRLVTVDTDHDVRLWETRSGEPLLPPLPHPTELHTLSLGKDGMHLQTVDRNLVERVWELPDAGGQMDPRFLDLCETLGGQRLTKDGILEDIPLSERIAAYQEASQSGQPTELGQWLVQRRGERKPALGASTSWAGHLKNVLEHGSDLEVTRAFERDPTHARLLFRLKN